jgi:hypothetical protein
MGDPDGALVARKVYESLFARSELELGDVPYALDDAVQEMRRMGLPAARWATFIHMGA